MNFALWFEGMFSRYPSVAEGVYPYACGLAELNVPRGPDAPLIVPISIPGIRLETYACRGVGVAVPTHKDLFCLAPGRPEFHAQDFAACVWGRLLVDGVHGACSTPTLKKSAAP